MEWSVVASAIPPTGQKVSQEFRNVYRERKLIRGTLRQSARWVHGSRSERLHILLFFLFSSLFLAWGPLSSETELGLWAALQRKSSAATAARQRQRTWPSWFYERRELREA